MKNILLAVSLLVTINLNAQIDYSTIKSLENSSSEVITLTFLFFILNLVLLFLIIRYATNANRLYKALLIQIALFKKANNISVNDKEVSEVDKDITNLDL